MYKKVICLVCMLSLLCGGLPAQGLSVSAQAAVVMERNTGRVLYEKNAHSRLSMASTTKIMTTLLVIENADLNDSITATREMVMVEGTSMGLMPGDVITYEGLCYGMLLESGNDAANAAAIALAGSRERFADLMNQKAEELGMKNSHFVTPSGLDDKEHYSTAYDMALLACAAMKNPTFAKIASTKKATIVFGKPPEKRTMYNHNKLLSMFTQANGVKTGYTKKSGRCLVSSAEEDGGAVVAVTLNAPNDWADHKAMLRYGLDRLETRQLGEEVMSYPLKMVGGSKASITAYTDPVQATLCPEDFGRIESEVELPSFVYAPMEKDTAVGTVRYLIDGKEIARAQIRAGESVEFVVAPEVTAWDLFLGAFFFLLGVK